MPVAAMDPRERVLSAIRHRPVDLVPCGEILVDDVLVAALVGAEAVGFEERLAALTSLGMDLVCLPTRFHPPLLEGYLPSPDTASWPDLLRWVEDSRLFVFVMLDGPFTWGARLLGWQQFLLAVGRGSEQVGEMVLAVERLNRELVARAVDLGAMGVLMADDVAHSRGLAVPPSILRERFLRSASRVVEAAHSAGAVSFFHSDGNLEKAIPDLMEAGFDGLQCLEAAAGMDLAQVKARYGDRLCLWGNLDLSELVLPRSREQLAAAVENVLSVGWRDGGLIFGTSSGLAEGVLLENLKAVMELVRGSC